MIEKIQTALSIKETMLWDELNQYQLLDDFSKQTSYGETILEKLNVLKGEIISLRWVLSLTKNQES